MLALLLTRPNQVVSTDRPSSTISGGPQPPTARREHAPVLRLAARKLLGADRIDTRPPGYAIRVEPGELDLERFETLVQRGDPDALREALALWRGPPLADFAYESFARDETARLEELRLIALERRIDADLEAGRHRRARAGARAADLGASAPRAPARSADARPLPFGPSGRGAVGIPGGEGALVEELGIEPGSALQQLEHAILQHDPSLDATVEAEAPDRSIVVVPAEPSAADALLALAEPLARTAPPRELILVALVAAEGLAKAAGLLQEHVSRLDVSARAAAFTSSVPAVDVVRLAVEQNADLVLYEGPRDFLADGSLGGELGIVLATAPCDVAVLVASDAIPSIGPERAVLVPFGGADHDWAAVELAAWIVRASGSTLRLVGREQTAGGRDASRLLAQASLMIQRVVRVPAEPLLISGRKEGVLQAAEGAALIVFGLSERWPEEGLGETRLALVRDAPVPTLLVRKGLAREASPLSTR